MKSLEKNHALIVCASLVLSFAAACGQGEPQDSKGKAISVETKDPKKDDKGAPPPATGANEQQNADQKVQTPAVDPAADAGQNPADQEMKQEEEEPLVSGEEKDESSEASQVAEDSTNKAVGGMQTEAGEASVFGTKDSAGKETVVASDGSEVKIDHPSECAKLPAELGGIVLGGALTVLITGTENLGEVAGGLGDQVLKSSSALSCAGEIIN